MIKRHELKDGGQAATVEADDGEWVWHEDHEAAMQALNDQWARENARMRDLLDRWLKGFSSETVLSNETRAALNSGAEQ